jgi:hypothetical protein
MDIEMRPPLTNNPGTGPRGCVRHRVLINFRQQLRNHLNNSPKIALKIALGNPRKGAVLSEVASVLIGHLAPFALSNA